MSIRRDDGGARGGRMTRAYTRARKMASRDRKRRKEREREGKGENAWIHRRVHTRAAHGGNGEPSPYEKVVQFRSGPLVDELPRFHPLS